MFHKFVILLNLRSLFWPRLKPAHENSGYPNPALPSCQVPRGLLPKMPRFRVSRPSDTTAVMTGEIWWQERVERRHPSTIKCPFGKTHIGPTESVSLCARG